MRRCACTVCSYKLIKARTSLGDWAKEAAVACRARSCAACPKASTGCERWMERRSSAGCIGGPTRGAHALLYQHLYIANLGNVRRGPVESCGLEPDNLAASTGRASIVARLQHLYGVTENLPNLDEIAPDSTAKPAIHSTYSQIPKPLNFKVPI